MRSVLVTVIPFVLAQSRDRAGKGVLCVSSRVALLGCLLVIAVVANMQSTAHPAYAQQTPSCSDSPISARGEPSRYEWLAKTKARANWRHRVRSTPELGTAYSDWKLAANLEESCLVGPDGTVCTITALPCRK